MWFSIEDNGLLFYVRKKAMRLFKMEYQWSMSTKVTFFCSKKNLFETLGFVGSCWFLSTVAALADLDSKEIIENVINPENNIKASETHGKLKFTFNTFSGAKEVIIDDKLPFAQDIMAIGGDNWVPLLEKAYAKFNGSYAAIKGESVKTIFNRTCSPTAFQS